MKHLYNTKTANQVFNEYISIHSCFVQHATRLDYILADLNRFEVQTKLSVKEMKNCVSSILSSLYTNIIDNCQQVITSINSLLTFEKEIQLTSIAHEISSSASTIINIILHPNTKINSHNSDFHHSYESLKFSKTFKRPTKHQPQKISNHFSSDLGSCKISRSQNFEKSHKKEKKIIRNLSSMSKNDDEYVVCRICEDKIPLICIEEHMTSCVKAYQSVSTIAEINFQLKSIHQNIETNHLNVKWPGPSKTATMTLIPLLSIALYVEKAVKTDVSLSGSTNELNKLMNSLNQFKSTNSFICETLKTVKNLFRQKLHASKAFSSTEISLQNTRISSSTSHSNLHQVTISDFLFIKRISRGAHAQVFLARKKKTGDIFAIKVIPKSMLKMENQIEHVLAEKNILLQYHCPFIVDFCMYIFC